MLRSRSREPSRTEALLKYAEEKLKGEKALIQRYKDELNVLKLVLRPKPRRNYRTEKDNKA
jgi:hypothetical protein